MAAFAAEARRRARPAERPTAVAAHRNFQGSGGFPDTTAAPSDPLRRSELRDPCAAAWPSSPRPSPSWPPPAAGPRTPRSSRASRSTVRAPTSGRSATSTSRATAPAPSPTSGATAGSTTSSSRAWPTAPGSRPSASTRASTRRLAARSSPRPTAAAWRSCSSAAASVFAIVRAGGRAGLGRAAAAGRRRERPVGRHVVQRRGLRDLHGQRRRRSARGWTARRRPSRALAGAAGRRPGRHAPAPAPAARAWRSPPTAPASRSGARPATSSRGACSAPTRRPPCRTSRCPTSRATRAAPPTRRRRHRGRLVASRGSRSASSSPTAAARSRGRSASGCAARASTPPVAFDGLGWGGEGVEAPAVDLNGKGAGRGDRRDDRRLGAVRASSRTTSSTRRASLGGSGVAGAARRRGRRDHRPRRRLGRRRRRHACTASSTTTSPRRRIVPGPGPDTLLTNPDLGAVDPAAGFDVRRRPHRRLRLRLRPGHGRRSGGSWSASYDRLPGAFAISAPARRTGATSSRTRWRGAPALDLWGPLTYTRADRRQAGRADADHEGDAAGRRAVARACTPGASRRPTAAGRA